MSPGAHGLVPGGVLVVTAGGERTAGTQGVEARGAVLSHDEPPPATVRRSPDTQQGACHCRVPPARRSGRSFAERATMTWSYLAGPPLCLSGGRQVRAVT